MSAATEDPRRSGRPGSGSGRDEGRGRKATTAVCGSASWLPSGAADQGGRCCGRFASASPADPAGPAGAPGPASTAGLGGTGEPGGAGGTGGTGGTGGAVTAPGSAGWASAAPADSAAAADGAAPADGAADAGAPGMAAAAGPASAPGATPGLGAAPAPGMGGAYRAGNAGLEYGWPDAPRAAVPGVPGPARRAAASRAAPSTGTGRPRQPQVRLGVRGTIGGRRLGHRRRRAKHAAVRRCRRGPRVGQVHRPRAGCDRSGTRLRLAVRGRDGGPRPAAGPPGRRAGPEAGRGRGAVTGRIAAVSRRAVSVR